jgi:hypothetical protein
MCPCCNDKEVTEVKHGVYHPVYHPVYFNADTGTEISFEEWEKLPFDLQGVDYE